MYAKLILRNVKRSAKDYLIYIVTLTICATLFYAFLSITSRYYKPDVGAEYDFTVLGDSMKLAVVSITLLLLFLIRYVNSYMLRHRQKEFAVQSVLGMEQRTIAWLFFAETFALGAVCVLAGIFLGVLCSQLITAMLLSEYGLTFRLSFMLFPDTVVLTVCFFTLSLLAAGLSNVHTLRRIKVIDMLYADRQNDPQLIKSRYMQAITALHGIVLFIMVLAGISKLRFYFDPRFPLPVHIMFWGNLLAPALSLAWLLLWLVGKAVFSRKNNRNFLWNFRTLLLVKMFLSLINACFSASVPRICARYQISFGSSVLGSDTGPNTYLMFLLADLIYLVFGVFYLAGEAICLWKEKRPAHTYRGQNLFFFGQITSRLTTTARTMTLICLTFMLSIFLFLAAPALTGWATGYLAIRALYDVQISTAYNNVYEEEDLPTGGYGSVSAFLEEHGIEPTADCTFHLYLPRREEFRNRIKWDFPVVAIALSDYNALRKMLGYTPISLGEKEFATQWQTIATEEERERFLASHKTLETDAGVLTMASVPEHAPAVMESAPTNSRTFTGKDSTGPSSQAEGGRPGDPLYYTEALGETLYNRYTDVIYIFPDSVCGRLLPVMQNRYLQTREPIAYDDALLLQEMFLEEYPEEPAGGEGTSYYLRTRTEQLNSTKAAVFTTHAMMSYSGVILMVICLTILSLQQLLDASQYRYRFGVLRKMGVEEDAIGKLILKQLRIWFGLPVSVAVLMSSVLVFYFFTTIRDQIVAYIGPGALAAQVAVTALILSILLLCFFLSTWILFKKTVGD